MTAALNADQGDPAVAVSLGIMLLGLIVVSIAALVEYRTGRSNFITRALERWSR